jgi:murein DD-endopeptidase MepM/ murein hydrolase activator NlpD
VADVRRELAESSEAMVRAAADLRSARQALTGARTAASEAGQALVEARGRQDAAAAKRLLAQTDLMLASQRAQESAIRVNEQRTRLGRVARQAYQQAGAMGTMTALLDADSPADFTERLVAFDQVAASQRGVLVDLEAAERTTKAQAYDFRQARDEVAAAHEQARADAERIADLVRTTTAARLDVERLVVVQQSALAAAIAAQAEDERRLLELRGESDRLSQSLAQQAQALLGAAGARAGSSYAVTSGVMAWPLLGPVTSPFGMRLHPVTGVHKLHTGTDFGVACGTPIAAARAGSVIAAGFNRAYGWRTVVSHGVVAGALLTTTYNHQTVIDVQVGQQVKAGEVIGSVGTTGYSTGCHLHFELIINSDVVDPIPWLGAG